jgi:ABC-type uncharacterized transport system involved in gliding motility auxiliary subunit
MANETKPEATAPTLRQRRMVIGTNVLVQVVAVLALVVAANWLASRHYWRLDWTKSGYYQLSEKTKQVLASLPRPVKVIVFLQPAGERDPEFVDKIYQDARNLLKEFQFFGKEKLQVEYVDPQRDMARARQLVQEYSVDQANVVIFASGERHKYVAANEMVDIDQQIFGQGYRMKVFKGEGVFLAAIQSILEETPPNVYFLTGHGERDPEQFDERQGYSTLATYIKRDNITVKKWNFLEHGSLPTDAGVIVIAGPRKILTDAELSALDQHLKNNGRLLVLLDPQQQTGLENFLKTWGVQADDDLVVSPILGMINVTALGIDYSSHAITAKMEGVNTSFPYARSIRRSGAVQGPVADQPSVTELVKTPPKGGFWGETDPEAARLEFDAAKDLPGPLPLAVAVERGKPSNVKLDLGITRMVVAGSSSFVDNSTLSGGNVDFFMNSLNWLLQREQLVAVGPKTPEEFRLDMTLRQVRTVYTLVIAGMPLAVAAVGLMVWTRRRR